MDAPASSSAPQVSPGEQPFVPMREEMPAEAAGGGPIANAIASTQSQTSQRIGSGVQLETIRENQVQAAQLQTHFVNSAIKMLYSNDPNNLGLIHQPASDFDQNVHKTRDDLANMASQYLDNAPNGIAKDMLRRGIANQMDAYEKDILGAGFVAHKAQMFSSMNDLANSMSRQISMAPNVESAKALMHASIPTIHEHMAPYFGIDDEGNPSAQAMKITQDMQLKGYTDLAARMYNSGDWASEQQLVNDPEVRSVFELQPTLLKDLDDQVLKAQSHSKAWNEVAPAWYAKEGMSGKQNALDEVNEKYKNQRGPMMTAQKAVNDYFGEQKNMLINGFCRDGYFPAGTKLTPKEKSDIYKQCFGQKDDPRDVAAANALMYAPKGSDEMHQFASMDWSNQDIFPGLTQETRQKYQIAADKASHGHPFFEKNESTAYSVGLSQVYHYWPTVEHINDLDDPNAPAGGDEHPVATFLNDMVAYAQKNPQATSIDMSKHADLYMTSLLQTHPAMLNLRAQEIAIQKGETSSAQIQQIRDTLAIGLKTEKGGFDASYYGK